VEKTMFAHKHTSNVEPPRMFEKKRIDDSLMAKRRREMVETIEANLRKLSGLLDTSALAPQVMAAMERVPRHEFVPERMRHAAYEDRALPISHGQTISQPFIVALMTHLLGLEMPARVLEIGTGSGYQAAVLAELGARVYSVEVVDELAVDAQHSLSALGYRNVTVRLGDGSKGWPEHAPYDGIIVTAASTEVPPALVEQLKPGGRMVIPIGARFETQWLTLLEKDQSGEITTTTILAVAFVPLVGSHRSWWQRPY
jgi:protein-L-isoaspartate(D-aspartate) O-methyltransferase